MTGLFDLDGAALAMLMGASYVLTVCASELYLHRSRAHRAVSFHPALCQLFRMWIWLTTYGVTVKTWVAVHRKHHAKCDTVDDPHSPVIHGIWTVLTRGTLLYRKAVRDADLVRAYGVGITEDFMDRQLYTKYRFHGAFVFLALEMALLGPADGAILWLFQVSLLPLWASGFINGLFHCIGYRNHATRDASRNFFPIGFIFGGAELHNNHHANPASARMSQRWWEFDAGYALIRVLSWVRLSTIHRH